MNPKFLLAASVSALALTLGAGVLRLESGDAVVPCVRRALASRPAGEKLEVVLADGVYEMDRTLALGTNESHVVIRAEHPGKATVVGGRAFRGADFVAGEGRRWPLVGRAPAAARDKILALDVPESIRASFAAGRHQGGGQWTYHDFDRYGPNPGGKLNYPTYPMLTVDCRRMELSRWPNKGYFWPTATNVVRKGARGVEALVSTRTGREKRWRFADGNIAAAGFTGCTYLNRCMRVTGYDATNDAVRIVNDEMTVPNARLCFFNILEELDAPGEWFYSVPDGKLYLYPPAGFGPDSLCAIGLTQEPLFYVTGNDVEISGLVFTAKIGHPAIIVEKGAHNLVRGCRFLAMGYDGVFLNGRHNAVRDCDFEEITATPVVVQGGVLKTMERGDNVVDNCRIRKYAILQTTWAKGGVYMDGVGNTVSHCDISESVETGIYYAGYANTVEYNRVHDVISEFDDAGVVYSPGGARCFGNVFRYNDLSGSPGQGCCFYLDDTTSGHAVYGNVFRDAGNMGTLMGGGRYNVISNNIIVGSFASMQVDNRGLYWPSYMRRTDRQHRDEAIRKFGLTNADWRVAAAFPNLKKMAFDETVPHRSYADNVWTRNLVLDPFAFASVRKFAKGKFVSEDRICFTNNLCVRTRGCTAAYDAVLNPEAMPTNMYSTSVENIATPIGPMRLLDGTRENPIDLGFVDVPAPRFDPWPYFMTYMQHAWVDMPMLMRMRGEGFGKSLGLKPFVVGDFNLKPDARLLRELPGFVPIPWKEIGLRKEGEK